MLSGFKMHVAAFDAIDLFGIGHGRDIVIKRRSRARRQHSPSPSCTSLEDGALELCCLLPVEGGGIAELPNTQLQAGTPDSVCEPASTPHNTSSVVPPDISTCSDATSVPTRIFLLKCYIESCERHEEIALSLPAMVRQGSEADTLFKKEKPPGSNPDAVEGSLTNSNTPLRRYLTDVAQTHEEVALTFESQEHVHPPRLGLPHLDVCLPDSSISLSDDPESTGVVLP